VTRALVDVAGMALVGAIFALASSAPAPARDFGVVGQAFPVIETDLLSTIEGRLKQAQATGELDRVNQTFAKRVEAKVKRPPPVAGLSPTEQPRSWDFDPTVTVERDVRDQKGNLIAAAGQRINPLDFIVLNQDLVFVDGDDAAELDWATRRYPDQKAKIIFVAGSPFEAMSARKRRFYFDQEGRLTAKFGIAHTPAVVSRAGRVMRVSEIVVEKGKAS
jgi:conjugal transfer pilus assembly protein TraW